MKKQIFSVTKVTEGGMGQKYAIQLLKENGIKARPAYSPYVGQSGVQVEGTEAQIDKAEEILYGKMS